MKLSFKRIMDYLKPPKQPEILPPAPAYTRSFRAAFNNRFINWLFTSSNKVNADLITQLKVLKQRSRSLSQNNQLFISYLINCKKSIIGNNGFKLEMQITNKDGTLNEELNDQIEHAWKQFTNKKNLAINGKINGRTFDELILNSLLVDGQCFIRIIKDPKSKFGVKFKLIDSMCVDMLRNQPLAKGQNGIFNGVQVDKDYKPIRYYIREGNGFGNYEAGELEIVPADQIIHLYRPQFIDQVRGYPTVVAAMDSLKQLEDMTNAELIAAKIQSCQGVFYERNGNTPTGDFLNQGKEVDEGSFLQELSPGVASIVPNGYSVKTLTPNHPNSQYSQFVKAVGKRVASAMGTNYNTLFGDLQNVNYSSLRQAYIQEQAFYKDWQEFLIEEWKDIQFELFLRGYLINSNTALRPSNFEMYLQQYRFIPKSEPTYDISKQMVAIERMLKLGLTSHIQEIEKRGEDPQELIKDEVKWRAMCDENNLPYNFYETSTEASLNAVNQFNDQANNGDDDGLIEDIE